MWTARLKKRAMADVLNAGPCEVTVYPYYKVSHTIYKLYTCILIKTLLLSMALTVC